MNEREPDSGFHDARLSELYRQLPPEEPGNDIDQALRAAARRAVNAGPGKAARIWRHPGWLASAATVLVCVGLVMLMQRQSPKPWQDVARTAPVAPAATTEREAPSALADEAAAPAPPLAAPAPIREPDQYSKKEDSRAARARIAENPRHSPETLAQGVPPDGRRLSQSDRAAAPMASVAAAPPAAPMASAAAESAMTAPEDNRAATPTAPVAAAAPAAPAAPEAIVATPDAGMRRNSSPEKPALAATTSPEARNSNSAVSGKLEAERSADYRQAMADADTGLAWQQLSSATTAPETAARQLDRDLLQQLQQPHSLPGCAGQHNDGQQLLCDLLTLHAAGKPLPADWRQQLDAAGLWRDGFAYRHVLLERLLSR